MEGIVIPFYRWEKLGSEKSNLFKVTRWINVRARWGLGKGAAELSADFCNYGNWFSGLIFKISIIHANLLHCALYETHICLNVRITLTFWDPWGRTDALGTPATSVLQVRGQPATHPRASDPPVGNFPFSASRAPSSAVTTELGGVVSIVSPSAPVLVC